MLRSIKYLHPLVMAGCSICLIGCESTASLQDVLDTTLTPSPQISRDLKGDHPGYDTNDEGEVISSNRGSDHAFSHESVVRGTGRFVSDDGSSSKSYSRATTHDNRDGVTLNLLNVPIEQAAKTILGEILALNYTISDQVSGKITIQTTTPVAREELAQAFETALQSSNVAIDRSGGFYRLVPSNTANLRRLASTDPNGAQPIGSRVLIVPLRHVSAEDIQKLVSPIAASDAVLHIDKNRNILFLSGTSQELGDIANLIDLFDIDWMRGMSFALYPVKASDPESITKELETIFGLDTDGPLKGIVRFVPNQRLGSILVISKRPDQLEKAREWISKLDKAAELNEDRLFVYKIQNRPAAELASVLQRVLSVGEDRRSNEASLAPRYTPTQTTITPQDNGGDGILAEGAGLSAPQPSQAQQSRSTSFVSGGVRVVADEANNALLIQAVPKEYQRIHRILKRLDVLPTQVMLEAVIAEITLNDDLRFGLKWYLEKNQHSFTLSNLASGAVQSTFPGFSYFFAATSVQVVLDTLSSVTKVNVVSSPSLMVMDNRKATLQIGDQVPISTQTARSVTNPDAPIVNAIEMKDTGVIFSVIPRVNDSGRVVLEVEQEVSSVVQTTTSDIDSPTIQQRRVNTTVVVRDGEVIALGGLIQQRDEESKSQIPILGDLPYVGSAFRSKETSISRTELVIFIRPQVVRNVHEARAVTEEFRERLNLPSLQPTRGNRHYRRDFDRALR